MKFPEETTAVLGCIALNYKTGEFAGLPKFAGRPTTKFKSETWPAARLSFNLNKKKIKKKPNRESYVLHKCDNEWCINPDHLYLGTREDNARDYATRKKEFCDLLDSQREQINLLWPHAKLKKVPRVGFDKNNR